MYPKRIGTEFTLFNFEEEFPKYNLRWICSIQDY